MYSEETCYSKFFVWGVCKEQWNPQERSEKELTGWFYITSNPNEGYWEMWILPRVRLLCKYSKTCLINRAIAMMKQKQWNNLGGAIGTLNSLEEKI